MAKKVEKKTLEKKSWESRFTLIGAAKVNDYTYKIDAKAEKSDWVYNSLNLGVDCGDKHGVIYAEMMGGYGSEKENVLYVHGVKDDNGRTRDDFENRFTIDWDDRFDEDILESVGEMCFITVGLEKDTKGNTVAKKFLSPYDAITYIQENLADGAVVNVKGSLRYSIYQDRVQVRKEINSIFLSKVESKDGYYGRFNQSMLLTKDSVGKFEKEKNVIPVYAKILEYTKMYKNKEVKQIIPMDRTFELEVDLENNKEAAEKWVSKILKVRKGVTEIAFEGDLIEGGSLVTTTEDDIPDDIKELIEMGVYTKEEALTKCSENTSKERRMVIRKPLIKMQGEEGAKIPVIQKFEGKYSEEDLVLDCMMISDDDEDNDVEDDKPPFDTDNESDEDVNFDDFLKNL